MKCQGFDTEGYIYEPAKRGNNIKNLPPEENESGIVGHEGC